MKKALCKGVDAPAGAYVYKVYAESYDNVIYKSTGKINLIK